MDLFGSLDKLINHLKNLTPKQQASTVDHVLILLAVVLLLKEAFLGPSLTDMSNVVGVAFSSYTAFTLVLFGILGSVYGCNLVVFKLSNYE